MIVEEAFVKLTELLREKYDAREAESVARIFLDDVYGIKLNRPHEIFEHWEDIRQNYLSRLLHKEPIQYITGRAHFFGYLFKVNPHVLIPRPETEELVYKVLSDHKYSRGLKQVIDIGSGSGCIPVTIKKKMPAWNIYGLDVSLDAVNLALINARRNRVQIEVFHYDFLDQATWSNLGMFDIIVSNPPYIHRSEESTMDKQVIDFEPLIALFPDGHDHLIFYRALCDFAKDHLISEGTLYCEINEFNAEETMAIFESADYIVSTELFYDLQHKPRIIKVVRG